MAGKVICEVCGSEMENLGLVPKLGKKVVGKQYFKVRCLNPKCEKYDEIKYVKPGMTASFNRKIKKGGRI